MVPYPYYLGAERPYRGLRRKTLRSPHLSEDAGTFHQRRGRRRPLRDERPHALPPAYLRLARRNPGGKPEGIGPLRILFTELPRRGVLGNRASGIAESRKVEPCSVP